MAAKTLANPKSARSKPTRARRKSHWPGLLLIVVGVGLLLAVILLAMRSASPQIEIARLGQPISDLQLTGLDGETIRLSDYRGRPLLINAWATWCPPCRAEMPALQAYYDARRESGLVLLAVNAGESREKAASFIQQQGFTFPVALDPNSQALSGLGIFNFPTTILVGADGVVKAIHIGLFTPEMLEREITPLLIQ